MQWEVKMKNLKQTVVMWPRVLKVGAWGDRVACRDPFWVAGFCTWPFRKGWMKSRMRDSKTRQRPGSRVCLTRVKGKQCGWCPVNGGENTEPVSEGKELRRLELVWGAWEDRRAVGLSGTASHGPFSKRAMWSMLCFERKLVTAMRGLDEGK